MDFIENVDKKEYSDFVINHKHSHFLKSYEWGQVSKLKGWEPFYVGLKKDSKLVATALLLKKSMPFGYSYFYIPRGYTIDYDDFELVRLFTKFIDKFTKKHKSLFFKIDPDIKLHTIDANAKVVDGENNYKLVENLKKIGFRRKKLNKFFENEQPRFTFRVNLDDETSIEKRYSKTVHRFIKKANNYDVVLCVGTKDDLKEFVRLMKLTEKRQNFYSHTEEYYYKFYDIFDGNVEVLLGKINPKNIVEKLNQELDKITDEEQIEKKSQEKKFFESMPQEDIVVSSYITVFYGDKSWYLYGANDMEYKMTYANYKLFDFQIKRALDRGKKIFDEFGTVGEPNTTNKLGGLHEFKKKFGGEYTEFIGEFDYIQKPLINKLYKMIIPIRRKIVRKRLRSRGE